MAATLGNDRCVEWKHPREPLEATIFHSCQCGCPREPALEASQESVSLGSIAPRPWRLIIKMRTTKYGLANPGGIRVSQRWPSVRFRNRFGLPYRSRRSSPGKSDAVHWDVTRDLAGSRSGKWTTPATKLGSVLYATSVPCCAKE